MIDVHTPPGPAPPPLFFESKYPKRAVQIPHGTINKGGKLRPYQGLEKCLLYLLSHEVFAQIVWGISQLNSQS